jgi:hypothetical protein
MHRHNSVVLSGRARQSAALLLLVVLQPARAHQLFHPLLGPGLGRDPLVPLLLPARNPIARPHPPRQSKHASKISESTRCARDPTRHGAPTATQHEEDTAGSRYLRSVVPLRQRDAQRLLREVDLRVEVVGVPQDVVLHDPSPRSVYGAQQPQGQQRQLKHEQVLHTHTTPAQQCVKAPRVARARALEREGERVAAGGVI